MKESLAVWLSFASGNPVPKYRGGKSGPIDDLANCMERTPAADASQRKGDEQAKYPTEVVENQQHTDCGN
jgi:hypothetical protein